VPLQTYEHFADRDPLRRVVLERMLAGVSTRRYRRTQEPVGEDVEIRARSKSSVSRTFVERTRRALAGTSVRVGLPIDNGRTAFDCSTLEGALAMLELEDSHCTCSSLDVLLRSTPVRYLLRRCLQIQTGGFSDRISCGPSIDAGLLADPRKAWPSSPASIWMRKRPRLLPDELEPSQGVTFAGGPVV